MLTLFSCPLITENKYLLRDPELSNLHRAVGYPKYRDLQIKIFHELNQSIKEEKFVKQYNYTVRSSRLLF